MNHDQFENLSQQAQDLRTQMEDLNGLADKFSNKMVNGLADAIVHGKSLGDVMKNIALSLAQTALTSAMKPLGNLIGSLFANANGNAFSGGNVIPFADGGVVNSPTLFGMNGATGLMGEAGPEAILPLSRGADGALGVRGGGGSHVTVNISTPDVQSFAASQSQVAAMIARSLQKANRNF